LIFITVEHDTSVIGTASRSFPMMKAAVAGALSLAASIPGLAGADSEEPATVVYGTAATRTGTQSLRADIYPPGTADCRGAVILVHGGSYVLGSRDLQENIDYAAGLTGRGFLTMAMSYRLLDVAPVVNGWSARYAESIQNSDLTDIHEQIASHGTAWPVAAAAAAQDVTTAIAWLDEHLADYGCPRRKIALFGASAGAIASMTVAYELDELDAPAAKVAAVIALRGMVYPVAADTSPFEDGDPPLLILHGDSDTSIALTEAEWTYEHAMAAGIPACFFVAPGYGHELGGAELLSMHTPTGTTVLDEMHAFLAAAFAHDGAILSSTRARLEP
jgi:acetyl esterase/lipase